MTGHRIIAGVAFVLMLLVLAFFAVMLGLLVATVLVPGPS